MDMATLLGKPLQKESDQYEAQRKQYRANSFAAGRREI